jgi:hypothetical protein
MLLRATFVVLALVCVGLFALLLAQLRDPATARRRVEALFRRRERTPRPPESDHYYRRYWS